MGASSRWLEGRIREKSESVFPVPPLVPQLGSDLEDPDLMIGQTILVSLSLEMVTILHWEILGPPVCPLKPGATS
jgi:hypothetical protein